MMGLASASFGPASWADCCCPACVSGKSKGNSGLETQNRQSVKLRMLFEDVQGLAELHQRAASGDHAHRWLDSRRSSTATWACMVILPSGSIILCITCRGLHASTSHSF